jgi:hypothetical protein
VQRERERKEATAGPRGWRQALAASRKVPSLEVAATVGTVEVL